MTKFDNGRHGIAIGELWFSAICSPLFVFQALLNLGFAF
jgi:hypothetical protein